MSLDVRARKAAVALQAATPVDTAAGLNELRRTHRRRRATRIAGVGVAVAAVLVMSGLGPLKGVTTTGPSPAAPPTSTDSLTTRIEPLDTTSWVTFTSDQYGYQVGHPADWTATPATRRWRSTDEKEILSPGHDTFLSPAGDVLVAVWSIPFDPGARMGQIADIRAWVEDYCVSSGNRPCAGMNDRAVELCIEKWDCHPGLLVPFETDVQAFLTAGIYDEDSMTVVAVWRGEAHPSVAPYGGSQRLLEAFLSTMAVWPAWMPHDERLCYGHPPTDLTCSANG